MTGAERIIHNIHYSNQCTMWSNAKSAFETSMLMQGLWEAIETVYAHV
jgi:hypothetical protein